MNDKARALMRQARERAGLKQLDVANKMGVRNATVSSWETGKTDIGIDEFVQYCQICGADFKEMLTVAYGDPTEPRQQIECTAAEVDLIRKFRFLDKRAQKVILRNLNAEYEDAERNLAEDLSIGAGAG